MHWRRKWQPTPVFLPREPQGLRGLVGCHLGRGLQFGERTQDCGLGQAGKEGPHLARMGASHLFETPWTAACQASLSITNSRSLFRLLSIASVMPSNHLILCCSLLLLPSIFPSIGVFSNESVLCIRWPKYWICLGLYRALQWMGASLF